MRQALLALALWASLVSPAWAFDPDEVLDDPALESRARAITQELRCLVCQNESIDASNAPLAKDLRQVVRARLSAGDTDQQVLDYVVARYGTYVLLRPPVTPETYLLWFGPLVVVAVGGAIAWREVSRATKGAAVRASAPPLTLEEESRLAEQRRTFREEAPAEQVGKSAESP